MVYVVRMEGEFDWMSREQLVAEILRLRTLFYGTRESAPRKLRDADDWFKSQLARLDIECHTTTFGRMSNGGTWMITVTLPSGSITTLHAAVGHQDPFSLLVLRDVVQRVVRHVRGRNDG